MKKIVIYNVTNLNDSGDNSLRDAIKVANENILVKTHIIFRVNGIITLKKSLPNINSTVILDAISGLKYINYPLVEINCNLNNGIIMDVNSNDSEICGFSIYNSFKNGLSIYSNNIIVNNNFIYQNIRDGIYIGPGTSNNFIGLNKNLSSSFVANLISGNNGNGIQLDNSSHNTISRNYIGSNYEGKISLPNNGNGILLNNSSNNNVIGEKTSTNSNIMLHNGNLISGNNKNGIFIDDSSLFNSLNGNFIGKTYDGNNLLPNKLNEVYISNSNNK